MEMSRQIELVREGCLLAGFVPDKFLNWMWMWIYVWVWMTSSKRFKTNCKILLLIYLYSSQFIARRYCI